MANEYATLETYHGGKASPPPPQIIVVDAAGGGDVTTIRAGLALTGSAAQARPYTVQVRNGTYNELQLTLPDWVTVEGESRDGVIMISNGLRTDIDPVSGQRYVDMDKSAKQAWQITSNGMLKNMTIIANDVKYCQHSDGSGVWTATVQNCYYKHADATMVGVGMQANQKLYLIDCIFEYTGSGDTVWGILLHNNATTLAPMYAEAQNCQSINCPLAILTETGSEQSDLMKFDNCISPSAIDYAVTTTYWDGGGHAATEIPYSLGVWVVGGTIPAPTISYSLTDRPNLADHILIE